MIKVCEHCNKEYDAGDNGNARLRKYCSETCQHRAQGARQRKAEKERKYTDIDLSNAVACKQCGRFFKVTDKRQNTFCSRECAFTWKHEHKKLKTCRLCGRKYTYDEGSHHDHTVCNGCYLESRKNSVVCAWCGETFYTSLSTQKYCSKECYREWKNSQHEPKPKKIRVCERCGKFYESKSNSPFDKYCSRRCQNAIRSVAARCKKLERHHGVIIEPISYNEIFKRDKGICHICGEPVHYEYDRHDLLSGTIDHVVALANGGHHTKDNLKLAHMICNSIKADTA